MKKDDLIQQQNITRVEEKAFMRISSDEREKAIARLQAAFVEGRLSDEELDDRVRKTLNSKTRFDLVPLVSDLPEESAESTERHVSRTKKRIFGYGSLVERRGRWRVPEKLTPVIFKGRMVIDLRAAELVGRETEISVFAYKGTIEVIVLPGVLVDAHGFAYKGEWINELEGERPAPGAKVIHIHGIAYKSKVIVRHAGDVSLSRTSQIAENP